MLGTKGLNIKQKLILFEKTGDGHFIHLLNAYQTNYGRSEVMLLSEKINENSDLIKRLSPSVKN